MIKPNNNPIGVLKLSIIVPFFNDDVWIGRMLDSLLNQDLPKDQYEIIVVDDGSTEPCPNLQRYADSYSNVFLHHQDNCGPSIARNKGVNLARGRWLYFCDGDDFIQPQILGALLTLAEENDLDLMICDWRDVEPGAVPRPLNSPICISPVYTGWDYLALFLDNPMGIGFGIWRCLVKRELIIENNVYFEDMVYVEDRIFQLDMLNVAKRVAHAKVLLYYYVQHKESILHNQKKKKYAKYVPWLWRYMEKLTALIKDKDIPENARIVLDGQRDFAVFSLLGNSIKYCPVSTTKEALKRLKTLDGAYPLQIKGKTWVRMARRCMNQGWLWLLSCRLFHIIPLTIRRLL